MTQVNIKQIKAVKKYGESFFEIAKKHDIIDKVMSDMELVSETFKSSIELREFFANPVIKTQDKKEVIKEIFSSKIEQITLNFLYIITDNSKIELLPYITEQLYELKLKAAQTVKVKAISAVEIKGHLREKLNNKLEKMLSKKVQIEYEIRPEIIGGLIVETEGKTIDNSVQTKIKNIKKQLI